MKQRGDTIIEVLLAMSVIGLVLGSSFGIANRSLAIGRAAQERTEALKIAESQLELLKEFPDKINAYSDPLNNEFCIVGARNNADDYYTYEAVDESSPGCIDIDGAGGEGLYSIVVEAPGDTALNPYKINVTWQRVGTGSNDIGRVTLYYKVGAL